MCVNRDGKSLVCSKEARNGLYRDKSRLLVFFLGNRFTERAWCGLEWRAGRNLLAHGEDERITFLRLDHCEIPGLYSTDGYLDIQEMSDEDAAKAILHRLNALPS